MSESLAQVMLLVDDQDEVRTLARLVVETEVGALTKGLRIIEASGGEQAISMCVDERIDVVVLDMHMPTTDGLDVLRAVKSLAEPPCVVAWSADELAVRRAIDIGAEMGVDKTDIDGLAEAIRTCLIRVGKSRAPKIAD